MADVQDMYVPVDDMRMHFQRAGSGPALVFLHGLVGSAKNWRQNVGELARESTVYALDLPNMGDSDRVDGLDAGLAATADRVAAWMDVVGLRDADIAAHSHGGAVALMLAARHPERVRKLVLFAPANPFCDSGKRLIRFYRTPLGGWLARQIPRMPKIVHTIALGRMHGDAKRVRTDSLEGYTASLNLASVKHVLRIVGGWDTEMERLREALNGIGAIPTLLIWGDRDRAVSLGSSATLRTYLPASSLMVIPGVGHLPFEEAPEICNVAIREWLRSGKIQASPEGAANVRWGRKTVRA
jgi:pimeloyl-ACP methyl ester carboxylesterase